MKKNKILLPILGLIGISLVSCGGHSNSATPSVTPTSTISTPTQSTPSTSTNSFDENVYNRIMSFSTFTRESKRVYISKDNITYYSLISSKSVDTNNKIYNESGYVSTYGNLDDDDGYASTSFNIYKDSKNTYTLKDDHMYYKTTEENVIGSFSNPFDFSVLRTGIYRKDGFYDVVTKELTETEFNTFIKQEKENVYSSISLSVNLDSNALRNIEYNFVQNGYNCRVTIEYTYNDITLSLPTNIAK